MQFNASQGPRPLSVWQPDGAPRAVVLFSHGMAEHIARYEEVGQYLAQAGWIAAGYNHAGHGPQTPPEKLGYFAKRNGWQMLVDDLHAARLALQASFPGLPFFLLGHSMGSFLAREYVLQHGDGLSGLVLSGTGWQPPLAAKAGRALTRLAGWLFGEDKRSPLLDQLIFSSNNKSFAPPRTAMDWLSRDSRQVDLYLQDPLCGFVFTPSGYHDLLFGLDRLTQTDRLAALPKALPVLLISGDHDPVGQMGRGVQTVAAQYRAAGLASVAVILYPQARHELFHEINRSQVFADLAAWLYKHTPQAQA